MDNTSILNGFQYTFTIMLVLLVLLFWQVYYVHRPKINTLQVEHESGLSCSTIEGMSGAGDVFGQGIRYKQEQSDLLANPGYNKGFAGVGQQKSGFFGGSEPPVFYDIGNVQAARSMRSKSGYSIVKQGDKEVLHKDGIPVNTGYEGDENKYYFKTGTGPDDKWVECPTAAHRTSADGYSCYLPEGMADPLKITTSGFGQRDPFAAVEDSVYGG